MSSLSKRCSACVLSGRTCRWELHSDSEWDELEILEKENEKQLDSVISKRADVQSRLAGLQAELAEIDTKFARLTQKKPLKDREARLLAHDSELLAEQDSVHPPNPPTPAELSASWDHLRTLESDPFSQQYLDHLARHRPSSSPSSACRFS
ncbi:hypothetical protein V8E54_006262 [Elaphomyces granulatus]